MTDRSELTEEGRAYVYAHLHDSIMARVAALGYGSKAGWPDTHVSAAINACNAAGLKTLAKERQLA